MKNKHKVNKQLVKLKFNAYKLKESGCIPTFLFKKISVLGVDSPLDQVNFLKDLTYKYLRIKDYYFRFPADCKLVEDEINKIYKERGYK